MHKKELSNVKLLTFNHHHHHHHHRHHPSNSVDNQLTIFHHSHHPLSPRIKTRALPRIHSIYILFLLFAGESYSGFCWNKSDYPATITVGLDIRTTKGWLQGPLTYLYPLSLREPYYSSLYLYLVFQYI